MNFKIILRRIVGTVLFIVGMVAWILPVLPGWPLIAVGLYILSLDSPGMQTRLVALKKRYPRFKRMMDIVEKRFGVPLVRDNEANTTTHELEKGPITHSLHTTHHDRS